MLLCPINKPAGIVLIISFIGCGILGACSGDEVVSVENDDPAGLPPPPRWPRMGPTTPLDLDSDGSEDYRFYYYVYGTLDVPTSGMTNFLGVQSLAKNEVQYTYLVGHVPLPDSAVIDDSLGWTPYRGSIARIDWNLGIGWDSLWSGDWVSIPPMNLALKLVKSDSLHFGWAKLAVDEQTGLLKLFDYAYQPTPNAPILAGTKP